MYWDVYIPHYTPENADTILDFTPSEGDRIDFSSLSQTLEQRLTFVGSVTSHTSEIPYSVFYKKGVDPWDNPRFRESLFMRRENDGIFKGEDGLSLMADLNGDGRADLIIAVWGVDKIRPTDLIL